MKKFSLIVLFLTLIFSCTQSLKKHGYKRTDLISFASPWTSPFHVDSVYTHQLINKEGDHILILNKTAWAYFGCRDPRGVLERAKAEGVNVIRACLEGTPYFSDLKIDCWPWGGTRGHPDFTSFNEDYWNRVEDRIRLAGECGIGIDLNIYHTLKKKAGSLPNQKAYWENIVYRLGKYANVLTWEIMNEYHRDESFQDSVGWFFYNNDPWHRPVITSDGTTDDALWPDKKWMGMAVVHTCTGSSPEYGLKDWYLAVARNTYTHGKPAFNNESGREIRHKNDDPVNRRKQAWIWYAAGCHWTWHSWEGCEGIDDANYNGPGHEFMKPVTSFFRSVPFWKMAPNFTVFNSNSKEYLSVNLAEPSREINIVYLCTEETGKHVSSENSKIRLPDGEYTVTFIDPANLQIVKTTELKSTSLGRQIELTVPPFTDDLAIKIECKAYKERSAIKGTE